MKESLHNQLINQRISQSVHRYSVPSEVEKQTALNSLLGKIENRQHAKTVSVGSWQWVRISVSIAAAVVIGLFFWVLLAKDNICNDTLQAISYRLPDQSRIVLGADSKVTYRKYFLIRELKLEGKGYFEVKKGRRFSVKASEGNVEVLGTRFMVDGNSGQMQVMCYEGKVKAGFQNIENEILTAGSGVRFSGSSGKTKLTEQETYPDFARFVKQYHNENVEIILADIEKFFDVNIENQVDKQRFFSGSITTGNLDMALSILTASLGLDFEHQKRNNIRIFQSSH